MDDPSQGADMGGGVPSISRRRRAVERRQSAALSVAVASALILYGMRRRSAIGTAAGIAGAGVLATLLAPRLVPRLVRAVSPRPISVQSEFIVNEPLAAVFAFFRNFENFPLLGGVLHSVDDYDDGRSRWRVMGRGKLVEWDVIVTKYLPQRVIAWENAAGAPVESAGTVRFDAIDESTTRVNVSLHYRPVTEAAARVFHPLVLRRPERRVRAAIGRIEEAIERSRHPHVHHRAPRFPLPEAPPAASPPPAARSGAPTQP